MPQERLQTCIKQLFSGARPFNLWSRHRHHPKNMEFMRRRQLNIRSHMARGPDGLFGPAQVSPDWVVSRRTASLPPTWTHETQLLPLVSPALSK